MMKLSEWARRKRIPYATAYRRFKEGRLPEGVTANQTDSGTIYVKEENMSKSLMQYNGSSGLANMYNIMDSLLDSDFTLFSPYPKLARQGAKSSKFRTIQEDNQYVIVGEVPGFANDEIKISVKNNVVNISGKHEHSQDDRYFSKETSSFEMSYTLPNDASVDEISAEHKHGLLHVFIPKLKVSQSRDIPIKQLE